MKKFVVLALTVFLPMAITMADDASFGVSRRLELRANSRSGTQARLENSRSAGGSEARAQMGDNVVDTTSERPRFGSQKRLALRAGHHDTASVEKTAGTDARAKLSDTATESNTETGSSAEVKFGSARRLQHRANSR